MSHKKEEQRKRFHWRIGYGIVLAAIVCLAVLLFFKILGVEQVEVPYWLTGALCLGIGVWMAMRMQPATSLKKAGIPVKKTLLLLPVLFLFTVLFTNSNCIRPVHLVKFLFEGKVENGGISSRSAEEYDCKVTDFYGGSGAGTAEDAVWTLGYGESAIIPEDVNTNQLYIAGYHNNWKSGEYLDRNQMEIYQEIRGNENREPDYDYGQAKAVWMDAGEGGVLLIGVDCVALSGKYVKEIRERLEDLCEQENVVSVNVYATHSHALPDTLGLWGPIGIDGKDKKYMELLVDAAVEAALEAAANRCQGKLYYGKAETKNMLRDSRHPDVYDPDLHQIRFESEEGRGVRLYFYGAHAESLRGDNKLFSRDFPGVMCDLVTEKTQDAAMFLPGAIGGLLMTRELVSPFEAVENLEVTGKALADYALSILPEEEELLKPELSVARGEFLVPLDNHAFLIYQCLGILNCNAERAVSRTGYGARSEMSVLQMGTVTVALIPGEIFPELVKGGSLKNPAVDNINPTPLVNLADSFGVEHLLILGMANEELGYIVPPSDFLLNEENPYIEKTHDFVGENHYEETNSVGPECAYVIAEMFKVLLETLDGQVTIVG